MRDMVQNHLMQLLCLIAMEPPYHFDPDAVRDEKLKVIRALDPVAPQDIVRGQYLAGGGQGAMSNMPKPRQPHRKLHRAETAHLELALEGRPSTCARASACARASEIAITFKQPPHAIFDDAEGWRENVLVIRLQPNEGMNLMVMIKEPGPGGMRLTQVRSTCPSPMRWGPNMPKRPMPMNGSSCHGRDPGQPDPLHARDEVEAAWAWTDPLIQGWEARGRPPAGL